MADQVRVLVVDDEEIVLKSVRRVLKNDDEHEFLIDTVLSANEGLQQIGRQNYDIIVTDLMMPGIDGLEFIDKLRDANLGARIIMITGYATMRTALQALRKGAFDYIAKPFTKEELRSVVKNAARQTGEPKPEAVGAPAGEDAREEYRSFLNQTYARFLSDGTMYFGVEEMFADTIGEPLSVELVNVGEQVSQGYPFGSITNADMKVFNLRAPLSGRVIGENQEAVDNVGLIREDSRGKGWLLQIEPTNLDGESENLDS